MRQAEIIMPMSSKVRSMKHWVERRVTKNQESTNDDGVAFGTQVKGRYDIHKLVVEHYVNDCTMLTLVDADGESDTRIENAAHGLATLFSLETSGYMPTPTIYTV